MQALEKIKASGKTTVYTPTPAELNEWKKALMPVHKEMEARVGKATIDAAIDTTNMVEEGNEDNNTTQVKLNP
mgnify:CR=1 FL=1